MDVFTHFAVPYLLLWALRRPHRERLAAGLGGYAPDLDVLTAPLAHVFPDLYFLGHRGVSHTLLGAPLHALVLVGVLALPWWSRRWPRMEAYRFGPRLVLLAMVASYTHLVLDVVTMWGVPLLWPWSFDRFTTSWFFYGVPWLLPLSAWLAWRALRDRADDAFLRRVALALALVLVASGALRAATHPGTPEGGLAQPLALEWRWATFRPVPGGWEVTWWSAGAAEGTVTYPHDPPVSPEAVEALRRAQEDDLYRRFRLYAGGPVATVAERTPEGAYNLTFFDLMERAQLESQSGLFPRDEERGRLALEVLPDGTVRER